MRKLLLALWFVTLGAAAQTFPSRPVRWVEQ